MLVKRISFVAAVGLLLASGLIGASSAQASPMGTPVPPPSSWTFDESESKGISGSLGTLVSAVYYEAGKTLATSPELLYVYQVKPSAGTTIEVVQIPVSYTPTPISTGAWPSGSGPFSTPTSSTSYSASYSPGFESFSFAPTGVAPGKYSEIMAFTVPDTGPAISGNVPIVISTFSTGTATAYVPSNIAPVPEPSRVAALLGLFAMGGLGLVWRVKR